MLGLEGGGGAALNVVTMREHTVIQSVEAATYFAPSSTLRPLAHYLFISSAFFRFSSLLVAGPKLSAIWIPGLAWWCSALALVSCSGWSEAVESLDSLATWSVRSIN